MMDAMCDKCCSLWGSAIGTRRSVGKQVVSPCLSQQVRQQLQDVKYRAKLMRHEMVSSNLSNAVFQI